MPGRGVYRGAYSALVDDPDWQWLTPKARLLFLTARLCKQAGPACIFRYYPALLSAQSGLTVKEVEAALVELEKEDWIRREGVILWLRNGLRHDPNMRLSNKDHRTAVQRAIAELPRLPIVLSFCDYYQIEHPVNWPSTADGDLRLRDRGVPRGVPRDTSRNRDRAPGEPAAATPASEASHESAPRKPRRDYRAEATAILEFLNARAGRNFGPGDANLGLIIGRLRGGATVAQCKAVISRRVCRWKGDPKMDEFLRPATLFSPTNFEQYVGELARVIEVPNGGEA